MQPYQMHMLQPQNQIINYNFPPNSNYPMNNNNPNFQFHTNYVQTNGFVPNNTSGFYQPFLQQSSEPSFFFPQFQNFSQEMQMMQQFPPQDIINLNNIALYQQQQINYENNFRIYLEENNRIPNAINNNNLGNYEENILKVKYENEEKKKNIRKTPKDKEMNNIPEKQENFMIVENKQKSVKEASLNHQNLEENFILKQKNQLSADQKENLKTKDPSRKKWKNENNNYVNEKPKHFEHIKQSIKTFETIVNEKNQSNPLKSLNFEINFDENKTNSLSEIFKNRKGNLMKKLEKKYKNDLKKEPAKEKPPNTRTKEEILKQRKEMMKKPDFIQTKPIVPIVEEERINSINIIDLKNKKKGKEPPSYVLERLAQGIKPKVLILLPTHLKI